jgi:hypothetical protein
VKKLVVRLGMLLLALSLVLSGCAVSTPTPVPTIEPTAVPTDTPVPPTATSTSTATAVPPTNTPTVTPTQPPTATPTRTLVPKPTVTTGPKPTVAPKTPPLATVILQTIDLVNSFKGALFGGGETCVDFFKQFNGIVNAPTFDVTGQPSSVQGAYGLYRQAVSVAGSKAAVFNDICSSGGGFVGKLDVLVEIKLLDQAVDLLGQALQLMGQ